MSMYRDDDDLQLLAELAGVLDQTVVDAGLSQGPYLVLRELVAHPGPNEVTDLAARLRGDPDEVASLCGRLVEAGLARARPNGVEATEEGVATSAALEARANEAMLEYVIERPHTATVYGLVAAMQGGRFTVEDLLRFIAEGPSSEEG